MSQMLAAFADMSPLLKAQAASPNGADKPAQALIDRMYMGFQYQDRISQMMGLLLADMQRLLVILDDPTQQTRIGLDHALWLERLQAQYAMAEQRRDHSSAMSSHCEAGPRAADSETEFF